MRDLPVLLEAAFRAAVRDVVFLRPAPTAFAAQMKARARLHFVRFVRASHVADLDLVDANVALDRSVERFATTSLRRRLTTMPVERLRAIERSAVDLVVDDRHGKRYALRFAGFAPRDLALALPDARAVASGVGTLLIYDIDRGRLRRFEGGRSVRRGGELFSGAAVA